jgi:hypothetical protein
MEIVKTRPIITMATPLYLIPREWLITVEPRIKRNEEGCWLWQGALDGYGCPTVAVTLDTGKRSTARVSRIVARMFWDLRRHHDVVQKCGALNCLNPAHFYVTAAHHSQEDRKTLIENFKRNLRK